MILTKVKGKGLSTCCNAANVRKLVNSSAFTILEVAGDWHELVIPWHIMRLSIAVR